ncbi:MAG: hypothetical protein QME32_04510 [Endomicrobiia bacterium]|nr:hypothetical protein [Endomicrobiia bacterium]
MKVLIIDSDKMFRDVLVKTLAQAAVFSPLEADGFESGISLAAELPDFIFVDMDAIADDPAASVARLKAAAPSAGIIVVSGMGEDEISIRAAVEAGASNLSKPFRLEQLKLALGQVEPSGTSSPGAPEPRARKALAEAARPSGRRNTLLFVVASAALIGVAVVAFNMFRARPLPAASFEIAHKNISYLSCSDGKLYVTDWLEQGIYVYSVPSSPAVKTLSPVGVFDKKNDLQPTAASAIGDVLWVADSLQGLFFRYNLKEGGMGLELDKSYRAPSTSPSGVLAEKDAVWSYDFNTKKLYRHNPSDMSVALAYDLPVEMPCGMARFGGFFYVGDTRAGKIIALDPRDMTIAGVAELHEYSAGKEKMFGLCADSKNLWTAAESGKIFRHDPSRLTGGLK